MAKKEKSEAAEKIENAAKAKKAGAPKEKKENIFVRIGNIFVRIGKWFKKFFKDLKGDIKKITWPNGKTVLKSTLVVIVSIAVIGFAVWLVDMGLSKGISGIKGLADNYAESHQTTEAADAAQTGAQAGQNISIGG